MKQETSTPADRLLVLLQAYALALLLAMFISGLHAGILFSLGDFLEWLGHWARPTLGERPADILVVLVAISGLFVAHIAEASMWAAFFWKAGQVASFGDGWYFAGVSHTALGYGDVVLSKPWRGLGPICAINGLLTFGCSTAALFWYCKRSGTTGYTGSFDEKVESFTARILSTRLRDRLPLPISYP